MYCIVLYCIVLYCIVLYCIAPGGLTIQFIFILYLSLTVHVCKSYRPEARGYVIYSSRALPEGAAQGQRTRGINHITKS